MILTANIYIYTFKYDEEFVDLCKLESRHLFEKELDNKLIFSNFLVDPSDSSFIKSRLEILSVSESYTDLLIKIKQFKISIEGFKVEYIVVEGDSTTYQERLNKLRDVGFCIEGIPDYDNPKLVYGITKSGNNWFFGILTKHDADWQKHREKPKSFSNAINASVAKTLISIASKGDKSKILLDTCCGVGTIMLEACIAGYTIEGCDPNWKAYQNARENLAYFNYEATVYHSSIQELNKFYDAAIIDLPYNLTTYSDDGITEQIITSAVKLAPRLVIVSISDISRIISKSGLRTIDFCTVEKWKKSRFSRKIWVCEPVE